MTLTNWPPPPSSVLPGQSLSWPPPGYTNLEVDTLAAAQQLLQELGWTVRPGNNQEDNAYFSAVRCERGHRVNGVIVTDTRPGGLSYPYGCLCRGQEQEAGALWPPFHIGHVD